MQGGELMPNTQTVLKAQVLQSKWKDDIPTA